jgi:HD superfamily phosphohydrolase
MTGSRYGRYDLAWLLQAMTVVDDGLAIGGKGVSAAEAYLQARYHMYRHVYFHKVVRAAEGMVKLALQRARELLLDEGRGDVAGPSLVLPPGAGTVGKVLMNDRLTAGEFNDLDDVSVMACFKAWRESGDSTLAGLCQGLLDRKLFKTIELPEDPDAAVDRAREAVGDDPYALFHDAPSNSAYSRRNPIRVDWPSGPTDLAEASPFVAALADGPATAPVHRLHVDPAHADAVRRAVG